jgi:hypothetical protein
VEYENRRGFLRGLATLPLIGGSVAILGKPTATAVPVTDDLLTAYDEWLDMERSWLRFERYGRDARRQKTAVPYEVVFRERETGRVWDVHYMENLADQFDHQGAASRAALGLSAVGCPLA